MSTITWIGLGHMGAPMSANLVAAGHDVRGFDLSEAAMAAAREGGVQTFPSMTEALEGAEVVITMLPKGEHSRAVYLGEDGVLALAPKDALLVDSSTIDVATAEELHRAAADAGFAFVDAPVSGGISGAAAGTLTFMIGGEEQHARRAEEIVQPMAGRVVHTGAAGTGQAAKIVNNMMLFICLEACSEGSVLADRLGLDPKVFWEIASVSSGNSWALQTWYPVPGMTDSAAANHNFDATFSATLAAKDIGLALAAGKQTDVNLPAARLVAERFQELIDEGLAGKDCSLIAKYAAPDGKIPGWDPEKG
ncbi:MULTISPECIES: 3-hydroxyisobutyrate dehydrogenase [Kocuria]|uniref:3-hydroxyisobutyrate dehydrogenase n=1 Tax=Kocuria TaxID=57493 RepID=UPI0008A1569D|nr:MULTISPECIES: 3-hydroxyisobutyrate dehydrogenase [Kocuria]MCT1916124.1 3-hydroxyisobutyrate dehydrogenase [Kocuria rhizophila]MDR7373296.1 3-hydroxyisobutyrate dehydrogenase [Kocuria rhizophila]OFK06059.1 3-hydroxyisobutyrate dehydrogenase [Kocuria sp. HMSC066H03]PKZ38252.1 3-hydroxyisobutyrate dehydrogenase [Kocuria rhizophila]RLP60434.1 3-hydroxyisobutyrate dehydrogenase [Kocuria rhizophila]